MGEVVKKELAREPKVNNCNILANCKSFYNK